MKEASVDCNLNAVQNSDEYINCFTYPSESVVSTGKDSYGYNPIKQDNDYAYIQGQQLETSRKGEKYFTDQPNRIINLYVGRISRKVIGI